jgi:hypothetical protein
MGIIITVVEPKNINTYIVRNEQLNNLGTKPSNIY